jgi:hypothetical protein
VDAPVTVVDRGVPPGRHRLGWLGSGAACFWIVLLSVRTLVA